MFCPVCRTEYREGVSECTDCDVALVDNLPPDRKLEFREFVQLMVVFDEAHIPLIKSVFDGEGLDYYFHGESSHLLAPLPLSTRLMIRQDQVDDGKRILEELGLI